MTYIGQFAPTTRAKQCEYCGFTWLATLIRREDDGSDAGCLKCILYSAYSDMSKDVYGFRRRFDYHRATLPQVIAMYEAMREEVARESANW